ncbi:MAG: glycosyltransferase [Altibacter sp.]|nr:glycosyltransferase [Altibacter sp.]
MISILIPTYNYNCYPLVSSLCMQLAETEVAFEVVVMEDASPSPSDENKEIASLPFSKYVVLESNLGRTAVRQLLAESALYSTLLFLDADVMPKRTSFIKDFLEQLPADGIVFGGITYTAEAPEPEKMLRWKYGRERESLSVKKRNENPYETVNSGCFMIPKAVFLSINTLLQEQSYGMDLLFKQLLKERDIPVAHIDNPVYHLGLEENSVFLKKALQAVRTTVMLEEKGSLKNNNRPLQKSYLTLKRWRLLAVFQKSISFFSKKMEANFNSAHPNLLWFDLYRLHHYIDLKSKTRA